MKFLDDIFKSIKAELYDRAVSPLIGSFLISWSIWNYKFLLACFSDESLIEKIRIIDDEIYSDWVISFATDAQITIPELIINPTITILLPAISTAAYIYAYPIIAKPVFEHSRKKQKELLEIKQNIDGDKLLTQEESQQVKQLAYEIEANLMTEVERKDRQIERLKLQIEEAQETIKSMGKQEDKTPPPDNEEPRVTEPDIVLTDEEVKILKAVSINSLSTYDIVRLSENEIHTKYALNRLKKVGFVKMYNNGSNYATSAGIAYLVENGLA